MERPRRDESYTGRDATLCRQASGHQRAKHEGGDRRPDRQGSEDSRISRDKWYGDKTYKLAATGTFKLGVSTSDIIVTTSGNTVTVKFPQPKIISVDLPFDKAALTKDVGFMRKDMSEAQLQAMYGKARTGATEDIKRNRQAFDKAEASVERTIEALVGQVDNVKDVKFTR
jgi:hypothetical protein